MRGRFYRKEVHLVWTSVFLKLPSSSRSQACRVVRCILSGLRVYRDVIFSIVGQRVTMLIPAKQLFSSVFQLLRVWYRTVQYGMQDSCFNIHLPAILTPFLSPPVDSSSKTCHRTEGHPFSWSYTRLRSCSRCTPRKTRSQGLWHTFLMGPAACGRRRPYCLPRILDQSSRRSRKFCVNFFWHIVQYLRVLIAFR